MRHLKRLSFSLLLPVVFLSFLFVFSSSAFAGEVWWHVQQVATPTHISKARETDEVQEITAVGEGNELGVPGASFEVKVDGAVVGLFATKELDEVFVAFDLPVPLLTRGALQSALEVAYGPGIEVSGEVAGTPTGTSRFMVTTDDPGVTVAPIEVVPIEGLEPFSGKDSAKVVAQPSPAGEIVLRATDLGDGPIEGVKAPVKLTDTLPAGLEASGISGTVRGWSVDPGDGLIDNRPHGTVKCSLSPELSCEYAEDAVASRLHWEVKIPVIVTVKPARLSGEDSGTVAGGMGCRFMAQFAAR